MIEFILSFRSFYFSFYNFLMPFSYFLLMFYSMFTPIQQSHRLATTVKEAELLPGVTTLFRDRRRSILGTFYHFLALLPFSLAWNNFNCWSEVNIGKHL